MKTLRKLEINPERQMKDEELKRLRGGYDPCTCVCWDKITYLILGYLLSETGNCPVDCEYAFGSNSTGSCQC
jgi:natural product precursor